MTIFKKKPPIEIFINFIKNARFENNYYISDYNFFKKITHTNILCLLINELKLYYHKSKQNYLNIEVKYSNYNTILRHICREFNIKIFYKIHYNKSKHHIIYYIPNFEDVQLL